MDGDGQQTGLTLQHQGHPYIRLASDLVKVQGAVTLNGGTVALNVKSGSILNLNRGYKILQSTEGVTGKFDQLSTNITSDYLYLSPALIYSGNDVDLLLNRNYVSFSAAGISRNQIAAGHAIDGLSGNNALPSALLGLDKRDARAGLDGSLRRIARLDSFCTDRRCLPNQGSCQ
ncbi:hypothetical protein [Asaia astilbis]|uniref:hypothetical protein n=1 Tax=Asaia astilbis TaxID=610244 RepID=UPI0004710F64|nr:hypothetical protein [Asaia astilbis]